MNKNRLEQLIELSDKFGYQECYPVVEYYCNEIVRLAEKKKYNVLDIYDIAMVSTKNYLVKEKLRGYENER